MKYWPYIVLLNVVFLASLGFFVLWKGKKNKANLFYVLFNETLSLFYLSVYLGAFGFIPSQYIYTDIIIGHILSILVGIFSYHFAILFTGKLQQRKNTVRVFYSCLILVILVLIFAPKLFIKDVVTKLGFSNFPVAGPLFLVHTAAIICLIFCFLW